MRTADRGVLEEAFPEDGILGEEGARKESKSGRRWIIDPIDGTRDFVRGNPLWGVFIGLEDDGEVVAGVVHLPVLGSDLLGLARQWRVSERCAAASVVDCRSAADAVLSVNSLNRISGMPFATGLIDWVAAILGVRSAWAELPTR